MPIHTLLPWKKFPYRVSLIWTRQRKKRYQRENRS
jgi:hypothetical protein